MFCDDLRIEVRLILLFLSFTIINYSLLGIYYTHGNVCVCVCLYPRKTNVFGGILESACLSVRVSVCVQNTSSFVSRTLPAVFLQLH